MLRNMLSRWGYQVTPASDGEEAWRLLRSEGGPRLAILDWMMPGLDGAEVCRRVRALAREPYVYILLLTARTESSDLVEGMDAGADDYLTKPFDAHELRVRLRAGRRILELQEELVRAREALRRQATYDGLTGVLNRTGILDALEKELARGNRERTPVAVLMADLDRFKQVNDTWGHMAGDAVLREAARRMQAGLRRYDSLGRYGGEEFLVVLPGCEGSGAAAQAERLRDSIRRRPFAAPGAELAVTCSLGVSWTEAPEAHQADALVRSADEALYLAKNRGRNRVEIAWMKEAAVGR
jgi:two-component system, cell cycle response regulator